MNFYAGGVAVAQLLYDGAAGRPAARGSWSGSDNASPANTWTVYFGQPALELHRRACRTAI